MRILVVEDDKEAAAYLTRGLKESGHIVDHAPDGQDGLHLAIGGSYDVAIVDRMMPRMDGLTMVRRMREEGNKTPVLFLSALGEVDDRVKGLRAGGDDYLPKPYSFSELLARAEVLARRRGARGGEETSYRVGDLELDRLLTADVDRAGEGHRIEQHGALVAVAVDAQLAVGDLELDRRLVELGLGVVEEERRVALQGSRLARVECPHHGGQIERLDAVEHQIDGTLR